MEWKADCSVAVVIVGCPFATDAVECAVELFSWRNSIEKRKEGELFGNSVWGDGGMSRRAEKIDEFEAADDGAKAGREGSGHENVGVVWGFGRAEGR